MSLATTTTTTTPIDTRKTVLITGATPGGIGAALAFAFHSAGYRVFPTARRISVLDPLAAEGMHPLQLDVTSSDSIAACHTALSAATGGTLDVLVNNAGMSIPAPAAELDVDGIVKEMYDINVFGPMRMVGAFTRLLIATAEAEEIEGRGRGRGRQRRHDPVIVNIGSIAPSINFIFGSAYNGSKAALATWGDALRVELRPFGVGVVTVCAGSVKSNIVANNGAKELRPDSLYMPILEWWRKRVNASQTQGTMETGEFARGVVDMVDKKKKKKRPEWFYWGGNWRLAWWAGNVFPRWLTDWIVGRMFGTEALSTIVQAERKRKRDMRKVK